MSLRKWGTNNGFILAAYDDLLVPNKTGNDGKVLGLSSGALAWVSPGLSSSLTDSHIFVGNGSNVATDVAVSGDLSLANTGAFTIANNAITTAKISNANVTLAKIANAAANSRLVGSGSSGSGNAYSEIDLGGGLSMSGTTLSSSNTGGWTSLFVSGSNFTTNSTSLVDITGLSFSASASTFYEIELTLKVGSSTNAGVQLGFNSTGTTPFVNALMIGITSSSGISILARELNNTAFGTAVSTGSQITFVKLWALIDGGTGSPTISARILKNTSGTATVYIGSVMRYRVFGT